MPRIRLSEICAWPAGLSSMLLGDDSVPGRADYAADTVRGLRLSWSVRGTARADGMDMEQRLPADPVSMA